MSALSRSHVETLINRVKTGLSSVELVHLPHERWPCPRTRTVNKDNKDQHTSPSYANRSKLRISVLDSSFNPPTLAHLALASLPIPSHSCAVSSDQPPESVHSTDAFDARLLLLSVRNADKSLKPTDATYAQRLEMMIHLSRDVARPNGRPQVESGDSNVAVAIIDEPTFVSKSRVLTAFLQDRLRSTSLSDHAGTSLVDTPEDAELTFIVGMDTLERILAPRYYSSPTDMRASLREFLSTAQLICSRRATPGTLSEADRRREQEVLALARDYLDLSQLSIVDIGEDVEAYSSSEVRQRIADGDTVLWKNMVTASIAGYIGNEGLYSA